MSGSKIGNLATRESVDESIDALITFMCDVLKDTEEYRKILEKEYGDCKLELKTSRISYEGSARMDMLYNKFQKQLSKFCSAFTQDYLDILTVALELSDFRVQHGSALKEFDQVKSSDEKFIKVGTSLARKIERIIKKHDKLAVVYNTQIDKLDAFHKHLERQLIIYTTNHDRKFVIPVKDYIAEFRSLKTDGIHDKKGKIISDHLKDMVARMRSGAPLVRIAKLEAENFDGKTRAGDERRDSGSASGGRKRRNVEASDELLSNLVGEETGDRRGMSFKRRSLSASYIGSLEMDEGELDEMRRTEELASDDSQLGTALKNDGKLDEMLRTEELASDDSELGTSQKNVEHSDNSEVEPVSLASEFEEIGEADPGMNDAQENKGNSAPNEEEMDNNDDASEIESSVEALRKQESSTDLDPDDRFSPERSTKHRYKSTTLQTPEERRESQRKTRKDNSQNYDTLRRLRQELDGESDTDDNWRDITEQQEENSTLLDDSKPGNHFKASEGIYRRISPNLSEGLPKKGKLHSLVRQRKENLRNRRIKPELQLSIPRIHDGTKEDLVSSKPALADIRAELDRQRRIKEEFKKSNSLDDQSLDLEPGDSNPKTLIDPLSGRIGASANARSKDPRSSSGSGSNKPKDVKFNPYPRSGKK